MHTSSSSPPSPGQQQKKQLTGKILLDIDISQYQKSQFPFNKTQANRMNVITGFIHLLHPRKTKVIFFLVIE